MALLVLLLAVGLTRAATTGGEMALTNITRFNFGGGDLFSIPGTECGLTKCMEVSHGTAMSTMGAGGDCVCQCHSETPAFREDQLVCVNNIEECKLARFGRGATKPQIPYVFLPTKGQIIYPSKEIIFTEVDDAVCLVASAQYLSPTGWMTLRDLIDNDVPFSLYRDEGNTFLQHVYKLATINLGSGRPSTVNTYSIRNPYSCHQWRGSPALHTRLEGRLVAAHVLCSAQDHARLASSCAVFRVAGTSRNALLDVRSIPFHAGETVPSEASTQGQGLSVLECLAIGVCVLMLIFVYAAGIVFYIHYKQRQKRKDKDPEMNRSNTMSTDNGSTIDSRIDMDNVRMKTNPLLNLEGLGTDFLHDPGLSDVSEHTEETMDSSPSNTQKFQKMSTNVISAMVHTRRKKPTRPSIRTAITPERVLERLQRRSASPDFERAPHSDLSIVDCSLDSNTMGHQSQASNTDPVIRRKLYFNPVFFETEHLKNPPPAAVDFLTKIREVMCIAKEKMTSKRFIPLLTDIPEEELYHTIDLGWDIPCARKGRRFSVISLKRENSRRAVHCGGCPGCDNSSAREVKAPLVRSNSCKSCVSDDYKQNIVRQWLDEVPSPTQTARPVKSVAKVSGTPRVVEPKNNEELPEVAPIESMKTLDIKLIKAESPKLKPAEQSQVTTLEPTDQSLEPTKIKTLDAIKTKSIEPIKNKSPEHFKTKTTEPIKLKDSEPIKVKEFPKEPPPRPIEEKRKLDIKGVKHEEYKSPQEKPKIVHLSLMSKPENNIIPKNINHATRRVRKRLPPPPPPPESPPELPKSDDSEPIPAEIKMKMEAVIKELNKCRRIEPILLEEIKTETVTPITAVAPKIVIPVLAADSQYYSDDNMLSESRKNNVLCLQKQHYSDVDSLERNAMKQQRRFSVACGPDLGKQRSEFDCHPSIKSSTDKMSHSWRDVRTAVDGYQMNNTTSTMSDFANRSLPVSEIFINNTIEPLYGNIPKPGSLTIQVRGSPEQSRRKLDQFDPDTLDRKPKGVEKKRVDKILLKSGGSFKYKSIISNEERQKSPEIAFNRKIGSLRQIYEAKAKAQEEEIRFNKGIYERRASVCNLSYDSDELAAFIRSVKTPDLLRQTEPQKPPVPPKQRRASDACYVNIVRESPPSELRRRSPEERERLYNRNENLNARKSGRRSNRTRSRRTDLRKLYKTEDSGYLSTDSNESKRRANYLMQLKPRSNMLSEPIKMVSPPITQLQKAIPSLLQIESDTDELESLCDGRSESGGESIETDSVFFGNFDESKQMLADLDMSTFDPQSKIIQRFDQIDSGFVGETNIILSESDSEHRSVISIVAGSDGRASASSIAKLDESPFMCQVEC